MKVAIFLTLLVAVFWASATALGMIDPTNRIIVQRTAGASTPEDVKSSTGSGGCQGTRYGCCADGKTPATSIGDPCKSPGGCFHTPYGCCADGKTRAKSLDDPCKNVGGCVGTPYGCCADGQTPAKSLKDPCKNVGGCAGTQYGCCADGRTPAKTVNDACKNIDIPQCGVSYDYSNMVLYPGIALLIYFVAEHVYTAWYSTNWKGPRPCDANTVILFFRSMTTPRILQLLIIAIIPVIVVSIFASLWAIVVFLMFCAIIAAHRTPAFENLFGKWTPPEACL